MLLDENYLSFATPRELEVYEAYTAHGQSSDKAGEALGITGRTVRKSLEHIRRKAERHGYSPDHGLTNPQLNPLERATIQYDGDGNVQRVWAKSKSESVCAVEEFRKAINDLCADIKPYKRSVKKPKICNKELCNLHILTDFHLGMYSWGEESGHDWDLDIGQKVLLELFSHTIERAENAEVGILGCLGDLLHWDGMMAVTPASRNILEGSGRYPMLCRVVMYAMPLIIDMMLAKYPKVHVIFSDANHDPSSQAMLRAVFHVWYEKEPRVYVDSSPSTYNAYEFGNTSLFFHHGHRTKPEKIDKVFVHDFREMFGRTKFSYAHLGHQHHFKSIESELMMVEQHRTLIPKDSHSAESGYRSGRDAEVITYHSEFGQVGRSNLTPEMLGLKNTKRVRR